MRLLPICWYVGEEILLDKSAVMCMAMKDWEKMARTSQHSGGGLQQSDSPCIHTHHHTLPEHSHILRFCTYIVNSVMHMYFNFAASMWSVSWIRRDRKCYNISLTLNVCKHRVKDQYQNGSTAGRYPSVLRHTRAYSTSTICALLV